MGRQTFFSFHFERDVWRAAQVRNSWVVRRENERSGAGFWDAASWEEVKRRGEDAIHRWIDRQLDGTSVTVVLIGAETSERPYVGYEIKRSYEKGNGLVGVYIHNIRDSNGRTDSRGANPFDTWYATENGRKRYFSDMYYTYDWVNDDGRTNIGGWIETAARNAGR